MNRKKFSYIFTRLKKYAQILIPNDFQIQRPNIYADLAENKII